MERGMIDVDDRRILGGMQTPGILPGNVVIVGNGCKIL